MLREVVRHVPRQVEMSGRDLRNNFQHGFIDLTQVMELYYPMISTLVAKTIARKQTCAIVMYTHRSADPPENCMDDIKCSRRMTIESAD